MSSKFQASSGSEITPDGKISKHEVREARDLRIPSSVDGMYHIHTNHVMNKMTVDIVMRMEGVNDCTLLGKYVIMVHVGSLFNSETVLKNVGERLDHLGKDGGYAEETNRLNAIHEKMLKDLENEPMTISERPVIDYSTIRAQRLATIRIPESAPNSIISGPIPLFIRDQEPASSNYAIRTGTGEHIISDGNNIPF